MRAPRRSVEDLLNATFPPGTEPYVGEVHPLERTERRLRSFPSIVINWIGWENALVRQDVVKLRRGQTPEQAVEDFTADKSPAKVLGWRWW